MKQEARVSAAVESIPTRETEYGLAIDPSLTIATRRANILNKMKKRGGPIKKEDLIEALRTYGIEATIQNFYNLHVMKIRISGVRGVPDDFEKIQSFVESICRAHVGKGWEFTYPLC
ncbi:YmfQ family protein [Pelotomaculum terephthalicicum JT]|uniref:putative phage tail protein n=1 Tax=Pelotomaculum TaxID=191373 RepID=UPI001F0432C9|nr:MULTISPECIES: putative phage tail protein [Pelotomaculum]MCG9966876.1 YmfQ family protein [Pelotomaculum terephthalicicum JT]